MVTAALLGGVVLAGGVYTVTRTVPGTTASASGDGSGSGAGNPTSASGSGGDAGSGSAGPGTATTPTTVVPKSPDPVVALIQEYDGAYHGTWTNSTAHTTGAVALQLRVDPGTSLLTVTAMFNGDLFGQATPKQRVLTAKADLGNPKAAVANQTTDFGPVTGHLDSSASIVLDAPKVPDAGVTGFTLTGGSNADSSGFVATFVITLDDGSTSHGTMTVSCASSGQRASEVPTICS